MKLLHLTASLFLSLSLFCSCASGGEPPEANAIFLAKKYTKDYGHNGAFDFRHISTHKVGSNQWKQVVSYRINALKCEVVLDVGYNKNNNMWYGEKYSFNCK